MSADKIMTPVDIPVLLTILFTKTEGLQGLQQGS